MTETENKSISISSLLSEIVDVDHNLIKDMKYFSTGSIPEEDWFYLRDGFADLAKGIDFFLKKGGLYMYYVRGGNGVGKTATVNLLLNTFNNMVGKKEGYPTKINIKRVNCKSRSTSYAIIKELISERKKISKEDLFSKFENYLSKLDEPLIVMLDDLQELKDDNVLYMLSRANEITGKNIDTLVIATSKYEFLKIANNLSSHTTSSLNQRIIFFNTYDRLGLYNILLARAERGLVKYDKNMLLFVSKILEDHNKGDARLAIRLMEKLISEKRYAEWFKQFLDQRDSMNKHQDFRTISESNDDLTDDEQEAIGQAHMFLYKEFKPVLEKMIVEVLSDEQTQFIRALSLNEFMALHRIIRRQKAVGSCNASTLVKLTDPPEIAMTSYLVDKLLERLIIYDLIRVRKVREGRSDQIKIEHKFTDEACEFAEKQYEDIHDKYSDFI